MNFYFSRFFFPGCIGVVTKLPLNNMLEPIIQYSRILLELRYRFGGLDSAMVGNVCNIRSGKPRDFWQFYFSGLWTCCCGSIVARISLSTSISVKCHQLFCNWEVTSYFVTAHKPVWAGKTWWSEMCRSTEILNLGNFKQATDAEHNGWLCVQVIAG